MSLIAELKRRNVLRVTAAYVVVAWLVIQVVETIFPAFGFGDTAVRAVVIALAIGLVPVVVYFYPSAYTQGCNIQAHEFAVNMDKFTAAGASVIGVSLDSIERLNDFSADPEYCADKLAVASDTSGEIARSYDLDVREVREGAKDTRGLEIGHGFAERVTFIVTPDRKIAETIGGVSPNGKRSKITRSGSASLVAGASLTAERFSQCVALTG